MSNTKWTPGPWNWDGRSVTNRDNVMIVVEGIAQTHGYTPPNDVSFHNARLIAAAPELYAALESILGIAGVTINGLHYDECVALINKACAALAKARGES